MVDWLKSSWKAFQLRHACTKRAGVAHTVSHTRARRRGRTRAGAHARTHLGWQQTQAVVQRRSLALQQRQGRHRQPHRVQPECSCLLWAAAQPPCRLHRAARYFLAVVRRRPQARLHGSSALTRAADPHALAFPASQSDSRASVQYHYSAFHTCVLVSRPSAPAAGERLGLRTSKVGGWCSPWGARTRRAPKGGELSHPIALLRLLQPYRALRNACFLCVCDTHSLDKFYHLAKEQVRPLAPAQCRAWPRGSQLTPTVEPLYCRGTEAVPHSSWCS